MIEPHVGPRGEREIVTSVLFRAARSTVFRAWTESEHLDRWWGPDGFSTRTSSLRPRRGGEWHFTMTAPDGTVFPNRARYVELAHDRLVYDHDGGKDGDPNSFRVTVSFSDEDGGTRVSMVSEFLSQETRDAVVGFGGVSLGMQTLRHGAAHAATMR